MSGWATKHWTVGELNALVKKLGERVARGILDGTVKVIAMTQRTREFLHFVGEITLPASTSRCDPEEYFLNRPGLWVSNTVRRLVRESARPITSRPETTFFAFDLVKPANDAEIRSELPEDHVFEYPDEFWVILAKMIDQQPNGEEGGLLANGRWNVFCVRISGEVYAVRINWSAGGRGWVVGADLPHDNDSWWCEGSRVFSFGC